ncbi:methyltransferase domain-containing protein [Bradyrhizobium neotropicale]|uniref:Trans-aconitate methyltransferase n=1 Tax=Bradyrhizobium neotropicale TaxID=1497615 RepID=A0A176YX56_9BRAD|nr:methyltransferase domain-containing protein [Bradyrhizobium neotropicale]OAF11367.1 trans-aconitate methyltransferase [Bradyrhizobium neotropicale]
MVWDPQQYLKFSGHRLRPAVDLLMRIPDFAVREIADLGAGAGNVTKLIKERWPGATVTGVEGSAEMVAAGRKAAPDVLWSHEDLGHWHPSRQYDLIYSNAALHWLPNHAALFPSVMEKVTPGGMLAVQMPRNFTAPSHVLIGETALNGPWRSKVEHLVTPPPVEGPAFYHDLLAPLSANIDIWETEYLQVLEGDNPVKEWTKGTWLTRYLDVLQGEENAAFEAAYGERVAKAYPKNAAGQTLFPFRRLFMVAQRKG